MREKFNSCQNCDDRVRSELHSEWNAVCSSINDAYTTIPRTLPQGPQQSNFYKTNNKHKYQHNKSITAAGIFHGPHLCRRLKGGPPWRMKHSSTLCGLSHAAHRSPQSSSSVCEGFKHLSHNSRRVAWHEFGSASGNRLQRDVCGHQGCLEAGRTCSWLAYLKN